MALTLSNRTNSHATLSIQVLGRFELRLDGRAIELPSRKARALLGYLVLNEFLRGKSRAPCRPAVEYFR